MVKEQGQTEEKPSLLSFSLRIESAGPDQRRSPHYRKRKTRKRKHFRPQNTEYWGVREEVICSRKSATTPLLLRLLVQRVVLAHHCLGVPHGGILQVGQTSAVLASVTATQRSGGWDLGAGSGGGLLECGQKGLNGLGGQVLVVVIVDLDHGGVDTGTQALNLDVGKEPVLSSVAGGDAEVLVDSLDDGVAAAASELAGGLERSQSSVSKIAKQWHMPKKKFPGSYGCADLQEVLANGITVVHGVEGSNLVDTHGGHLEHAGDLVHDADASVAVLALAEVQKGHDGSLLVLGRVTLKDLIGKLEVLVGKREGERRVVSRLVAVLLN